MPYIILARKYRPQDFDEVIRLNPQRSGSYRSRGSAYLHLDQFETAIEDFNEAIRINPTDALAYASRAWAYTLLGMDTEAEQDILQAVVLGVDSDTLKKDIEELKKQR